MLSASRSGAAPLSPGLQAPKGKKVAAAPAAVKKAAAPAKPVNPLYEKRPKTFSAPPSALVVAAAAGAVWAASTACTQSAGCGSHSHSHPR